MDGKITKNRTHSHTLKNGMGVFFIRNLYLVVMTTFLDFSRKNKYYLNKDIKQNNY